MSTVFHINDENISVKRPHRQLPKNPRFALVAEGGGQRGIYTAGILDAFLARDFSPFETLVGTSAGAQNVTSYFLKQAGFARKSIHQLSTHKEFFKPRNLFSDEHSMDLDWFFDSAQQNSNSDLGLPIKQLNNIRPGQLLIVASDVDSKETLTLCPTERNIFHLLKASSAIPFLYKSGVQYQGRTLVDGGLTAPIPLQQAFDRNANIVVVIRTVPSNKESESLWKQKAGDSIRDLLPENLGDSFSNAVNEHLHLLPTIIKEKIDSAKMINPLQAFYDRNPQYRTMYDLMKLHDSSYDKTLALISKPPQDSIVLEIAPAQALASRSLASSTKALEEDYQLGVKTGDHFLDNFAHFFQ
jgi:predicted patatin/cPLA2 family phospholipase